MPRVRAIAVPRVPVWRAAALRRADWLVSCSPAERSHSHKPRMMYHAYQAHSDLMWPLRTAARFAAPMLLDPSFAGFGGLGSPRQIAAACKLLELTEVTHKRPAWAIDSVVVDGETLPVDEDAVHSTPFATLMRFSTPRSATQPKVLLVAPMSGHFATL